MKYFKRKFNQNLSALEISEYQAALEIGNGDVDEGLKKLRTIVRNAVPSIKYKGYVYFVV